MDMIEAIMTRRSVRKYLDREIPEELLHTLLAAAMNAPSAGNQQPWDFIIIRDKAVLAGLHKINPHAAMAGHAPLAILVCADLSRETHPGYWVIDCSAAVQNMLLAAHSSGLGAVWTGVHPKQDRIKGLKELFKLPEHIMPHSLVVLGWPAETPKPVNRFNDRLVHLGGW
ncbi:MAG: nitroreductase family protein [Myxococcota bacterium]|jgi:nitroreductase